MNVTIVDYNSGNISSVINSFKEVAQDKANIEVSSDLNKIKLSDKVVLPGQGSFKSCIDALKNISGLVDTLNEFAINNKKSNRFRRDTPSPHSVSVSFTRRSIHFTASFP